MRKKNVINKRKNKKKMYTNTSTITKMVNSKHDEV